MMQKVAFQCQNCGQCCGPVPFTEEDKARIKNHLIKLSTEEYGRLYNQKREPFTCPFRDIEKKLCGIYPVRPETCKMQGYYEGLACPYQPQFAVKSREEGKKRLTGEV